MADEIFDPLEGTAQNQQVKPVGTNELIFEPQQRDVMRYAHKVGLVCTWEGDGWYDECRSWFETCYIHAGISGFQFTYKGPDAQQMLSDVVINDVFNWKIGTCKHLVTVDEEGLVTSHALFMRDAEDVFRTTAGVPDVFLAAANSGKYDMEFEVGTAFIFQFSGPKSLTILEKLAQTDLHDVKFLETRMVHIASLDADVELRRIGMSGTLAYEICGDPELGPAVYAAAYEAGKPYGIKRLGWRSYPVNHTYGGYPQCTCSFEVALFKDEMFRKTSLAPWVPSGSVDPADMRARFRTLEEVDWMWMAKFDHDFVGRKAVEQQKANPKRKLVSLEWNVDDIMDIHRSLYEDGEPYKPLEYPCAEQQPAGGHQDYVTDADGNVVGYASVGIYSSWYHKMISPAVIDIELAEPGRELILKWGDFGGRIKDVCVTVDKYPLIDIDGNRNYPVNTVESGL